MAVDIPASPPPSPTGSRAQDSRTIAVTARFAFEFEHSADALLQFEAAALPEQRIDHAEARISANEHRASIPAHDDMGSRIWLRASGRVEVDYQAQVTPNRIVSPLRDLAALPTHRLPGETVQYLIDSRYCHASEFLDFTESEFAGTSGGARIAAIREWVKQHVNYEPGASGPATTATDTFHAGAGICRDFAHLVLTLARASAIPARYVACYAPGVKPQDFHAVAQVFLADPSVPGGGLWQLVDATGMADLARAAIIGVGRDAADVSFLTTFAPTQFLYSEVDVRKL
ncbi:MAG: transglutaminase family protein [Pseudomonadota bacterium]